MNLDQSDIEHGFLMVFTGCLSLLGAIFVFVVNRYHKKQEDLENAITNLKERVITLEDNHITRKNLDDIVEKIEKSIENTLMRVHQRIDDIYKSLNLTKRAHE